MNLINLVSKTTLDNVVPFLIGAGCLFALLLAGIFAYCIDRNSKKAESDSDNGKK